MVKIRSAIANKLLLLLLLLFLLFGQNWVNNSQDQDIADIDFFVVVRRVIFVLNPIPCYPKDQISLTQGTFHRPSRHLSMTAFRHLINIRNVEYFTVPGSLEVAQIYLPGGVVWVGGYTVIIGLISVQLELSLGKS